MAKIACQNLKIAEADGAAVVPIPRVPSAGGTKISRQQLEIAERDAAGQLRVAQQCRGHDDLAGTQTRGNSVGSIGITDSVEQSAAGVCRRDGGADDPGAVPGSGVVSTGDRRLNAGDRVSGQAEVDEESAGIDIERRAGGKSERGLFAQRAGAGKL